MQVESIGRRDEKGIKPYWQFYRLLVTMIYGDLRGENRHLDFQMINGL